MSPARRHRKSARARDCPARQPQSHVRKVILRVGQPDSLLPSAPESLPPMLPLPPEILHEVPRLPPTPPLPPHLPPSVAGLPIPNDSQQMLAGLPANAPLTYAHPYGASFYPPAYPPVPYHHAYGAGISTAPPQPWGYAQYPMALPPAPFLMDPSAAPHTMTGEEDSPLARDTHGRVANGPEGRAALGRGNGGVGTNGAASSTAVTRLGRSYPNKEVSAGVWEFRVEVVDDNIKHTFNAHTDMKWHEFLDEVHRHFERLRSEVRVGYRISGDTGAMSYLSSEYDWNDALARLMGKVRSARTRAVSMEIKNMQPSTTSKAHVVMSKVWFWILPNPEPDPGSGFTMVQFQFGEAVNPEPDLKGILRSGSGSGGRTER
ncbi:hypothetical protein H4582DRAFT_2078387 [Lactarius indigo]|nr:hypothetical protein H4582DRAFT_2078387 [Lactarius indigo]